MSIWQEELQKFRDVLASSEPAPGGGSAAMVSAALGCGLFMMSAEIALAREGASAELPGILKELGDLMQKISAHADEDISAYENYVAARKLPKDTEEEKSFREAAMKEALRRAADAPALAAADALSALKAGSRLVPLVPAGILSDVGGGAALLLGGINSALFTLQSNIRLTKDAERKAELTALKEKLSAEARNISAEIERAVEEKLSAD